MESLEIRQVPAGVSFEELRSSVCAAVGELNGKRVAHSTAQFAPVQVNQIPHYAKRGEYMLVVSFTPGDACAQRYIRREILRLTALGEARCRVPKESWFFVSAAV